MSFQCFLHVVQVESLSQVAPPRVGLNFRGEPYSIGVASSIGNLDVVFYLTEDAYRMSHSGAEKPAGESDHVKRHRPSPSHATRAGALCETVGAMSGTSGCDPESFIRTFGQSGRSPRWPGAFNWRLTFSSNSPG